MSVHSFFLALKYPICLSLLMFGVIQGGFAQKVYSRSHSLSGTSPSIEDMTLDASGNLHCVLRIIYYQQDTLYYLITDPNGNVLTSRKFTTFSGTDSLMHYGIILTLLEDSAILFSAGIMNYTTNQNYAVLQKRSATDSLLWTRTYPFQQFNAIVPESDGGFVASVSKVCDNGSFVRIDQSGNIIWEKRYFPLSTSVPHVASSLMKPRPDRYLYAAHFYHWDTLPPLKRHLGQMLLDSSLTPISLKLYRPFFSDSIWYFSMNQMSYNRFLFCGTIVTSDAGSAFVKGNGFMFTTDLNGYVDWGKTYHTQEGISLMGAYRLGDFIYAAGHLIREFPLSQIVMIKFDTTGVPVWHVKSDDVHGGSVWNDMTNRFYPGKDDCFYQAGTTALDGAILVKSCGDTRGFCSDQEFDISWNSIPVPLIHHSCSTQPLATPVANPALVWSAPQAINVTEYCHGFVSVPKISVHESNVSVFPNPASGLININMDGYSGWFRATLFDLQGRKVLEARLVPGEPLDISRVAPGAYMCRVSGCFGELLHTTKVIVSHRN
ncbi:MAG: T9SS type A sorting domain-containing protein [Bacteroidales bacterium]